MNDAPREIQTPDPVVRSLGGGKCKDLSCASLWGIVTLSHAPQLSVSYPLAARRLAIEYGHEGNPTRGDLLRRYIQKSYPERPGQSLPARNLMRVRDCKPDFVFRVAAMQLAATREVAAYSGGRMSRLSRKSRAPHGARRLRSTNCRIRGVKISCIARSNLLPGITMEFARDMKLC